MRASLLVVTIVTSLAVMLLSHCGSVPVAEPVASTRPDGGGALRMIQEEPVGLDPIQSESVYESLPINQIFDTLVASDDSLNVAPSLAESWKISRDGLQYDIRLRDDVRFHDGKVLTAEDVVFTFHRVLRIGGTDSLAYPYLTVIEGAEEYVSGAAAEMVGVTQQDDRTVRFQLKHRNPLFLELLTMDNLSIVPKHLLSAGDAAQDDAFARAPIGTGPFVFGEWTDDHIRLDRNGSYFGGPAHLEEVRLNFYGEDESDYGEARYLAGELDLLEPTGRSLARMQELAGTHVQQFQELSISFLGMNTSRPPLDQQWLRQAIAHAIDRDGMVAASPTLQTARVRPRAIKTVAC
jgi:ABC-type transport system substrate-binding protein